MNIAPTPEQSAIFEATVSTTDSLMISADAGCAKTTTLEMLAHQWHQGLTAQPSSPPALALAFNVKIKTELERRLPSSFKVMTLNGLGSYAWWRAICKKTTIDEKKLGRLVTATAKAQGLRLSSQEWDDVRRLVTLGMNKGIVPATYPQRGLAEDRPEVWANLADESFLDLYDEHIALARAILDTSVHEAFDGVMSFDDQIYMSALFNGVFPSYQLLLVDEAQDLSPLNHIQIRKCGRPRLIVCGDPKQAIYAFRGADHTSMDKLRDLRPAWVDLPLHTTFRCPKAIVARQQTHAPGFTAAPANPQGEVLDWQGSWPSEGQEPAPQWDLAALKPYLGSLFILCRNNGPIFKMAMKLLKARVGCNVLGRDIGKNLITLSKKVAAHDSMPQDQVLAAIDAWAADERAKALAKGDDHKVAAIEDRAESLSAIAEECANAGELRKALETIFSAEGTSVTLSSIHRAKGLEAKTVLHLDPWRIPSKYAKRALGKGDPSQMVQENNLRYVCETRTKQTLILANMKEYGE